MAEKIAQIKKRIDYSLHSSSKPWTPLFALAEKQTGINRVNLFYGT